MTSPAESLAGRVVLVTGAARGLGLTFADAIARAGASVALLDVLPETEAAAAQVAADTGAATLGVHCDVTDEESVRRAVELATEALGAPDGLVNSAGIARNAPAQDMSVEDFRRVVDINLTGTFIACRELGRRLIEAGRPGSIVNVSSMSGHIVNVPQPQCAYNASKAGVALLTKSLAVEWIEHGIRVNSVAPGYIATAMTRQVREADPEMAAEWVRRTPAGRLGEPTDIAPVVVFLLSDAAPFIVGHDLVADGGYTAV